MDEEHGKLMEKLERLKIYMNLATEAIWERYKTLSTVSSLSATLLVVATFNENLIQINFVTKFLLTVLLILIPASLIMFLHELHCSELHARKKIDEISGRQVQSEIKGRIRNYFPWIATAILTIVIIWIIFLIWNCR